MGGRIPLLSAPTQPAPHAHRSSPSAAECSLSGQAIAVAYSTPTAGTPRNAPIPHSQAFFILTTNDTFYR